MLMELHARLAGRRTRRNRRGEVGRNEILIGVAVVALLLLIAVPLGLSSQKKSARSEVPLLVKAIHQAELDYKSAFEAEGFVACEAAPRAMTAVDQNTVSWKGNRGFDRLAWAPETTELYGAYKVALEGKGFTVTGACDIDGDGARAQFTANAESTEATMATEANVY